jgi:hypothetical protein
MRRLASDRQRANLALFADLLHLANSAIFRAKGGAFAAKHRPGRGVR